MNSGIKRIMIIGAGIGGLSTAIALNQAGFEVDVYERTASIQAVGAGITLWANAMRALRSLGLRDAVAAAGAAIQTGEIATWQGRVLQRTEPGELARLYGDPTVALHRAALQEILKSSLPEQQLHLGQTFQGFEQENDTITACFEGGHRQQADLIVGVDGLHSLVRAKLFPSVRPRYAGYTAWRGVTELPEQAVLGATRELWGCGRRFGIVRIDARRIYWFATDNTQAGQQHTPEEHKALMLQYFKGWIPPVEALIAATPAASILYNDLYDLKPFTPWGQGRLILLGDAAHATTPNLGQGACQAIESAVVLARCLKESASLPEALQRYQAVRQPRTAWITNQSWQVGQVAQLGSPILCKVRDFVMRAIPKQAVERQLRQAMQGFEA